MNNYKFAFVLFLIIVSLFVFGFAYEYFSTELSNETREVVSEDTSVAFCITGQWRSFSLKRVRRSVHLNLLEGVSFPLRFDVFIHVDPRLEIREGDKSNTSTSALGGRRVSAMHIEKVLKQEFGDRLRHVSISSTVPDLQSQTFDTWAFREFDLYHFSMFYHRHACYQEILNYEHARGRNYSFIGVARTDIAWPAKLRGMVDLPLDSIYVPAMWHTRVNDLFAFAPRHLANRIFDINHISKFWCINSYSSWGDRYKNGKCDPWDFLDAGYNSSILMRLVKMCCMQPGMTPRGHDGLIEGVTLRAYCGEEVNTSICEHDKEPHQVYRNISMLNLPFALVRSYAGPDCARFWMRSRTMIAKNVSTSIAHYISCHDFFSDCSFSLTEDPRCESVLSDDVIKYGAHPFRITLSSDSYLCLSIPRSNVTENVEVDLKLVTEPCASHGIHIDRYWTEETRESLAQAFLLTADSRYLCNYLDSLTLSPIQKICIAQDLKIGYHYNITVTNANWSIDSNNDSVVVIDDTVGMQRTNCRIRSDSKCVTWRASDGQLSMQACDQSRRDQLFNIVPLSF